MHNWYFQKTEKQQLLQVEKYDSVAMQIQIYIYITHNIYINKLEDVEKIREFIGKDLYLQKLLLDKLVAITERFVYYREMVLVSTRSFVACSPHSADVERIKTNNLLKTNLRSRIALSDSH